MDSEDRSTDEVERSMEREMEGLLELDELDRDAETEAETEAGISGDLARAEDASQPHTADVRRSERRTRQR